MAGLGCAEVVVLLCIGAVVLAVVGGALGGRTRYCTVCQKPVQAVGGFLTARRCPMCRNSGTLQKL